MRSTLAFAVLGCLFSGSAHAELIYAELNGHITRITESQEYSGDNIHYPTSYLGLSVGETVRGFLRYDTNIPLSSIAATTPSGYGLTLSANGMVFSPIVSFWVDGSGPPGTIPTSLSLGNFVRLDPDSSLSVWKWTGFRLGFLANDPQGKLFSPSHTTLPGSAALANYSPQGNASMSLTAELTKAPDANYVANFDIAMDSIDAGQTPEPSALVLFSLGGLSLLGLAPRRIAARLVRGSK